MIRNKSSNEVGFFGTHVYVDAPVLIDGNTSNLEAAWRQDLYRLASCSDCMCWLGNRSGCRRRSPSLLAHSYLYLSPLSFISSNNSWRKTREIRCRFLESSRFKTYSNVILSLWPTSCLEYNQACIEKNDIVRINQVDPNFDTGYYIFTGRHSCDRLLKKSAESGASASIDSLGLDQISWLLFFLVASFLSSIDRLILFLQLFLDSFSRTRPENIWPSLVSWWIAFLSFHHEYYFFLILIWEKWG